jgi:hypothetical protein
MSPDAPSGADVPGLDAPGADVPGLDAPAPPDVPGLDAPAPPDVLLTGCDVNSQCVIRAESCCGSCGAATADDWIALNVADLDDYSAAVCVGIGCPECARPDDPWLVASCSMGDCVGTDLRLSPLTECAAASDCVLGPRQCCDCGLLGELSTIAYNPARGSPYGLICDPDIICPPCVPTFDGLAADCVGGRCVVELATGA